MTDPKTLGATIKRLRDEQELSLSQLAKDAEVSKGYLWKLEDGEADVRPSGDTLYKVARALGTSMSELLGKAVLVDAPTEAPPGLAEFANSERLRDRDVAMLAQVNFRGRQPDSPEDWSLVWSAIKRSVS